MKLTPEQEDLAKKLNKKQLTFANLVLIKDEHGKSYADCYREAGYKPRTQISAEVSASKLLSLAKVSDYVNSFKLLSAQETGLTLEYLDNKLKNIIDTDISDFLTTQTITIPSDDGNDIEVRKIVFKEDIQDLPPNVVASINSVKQTKEGIQFNLPDKKATLELAYRRLGALVDKRESELNMKEPIKITSAVSSNDASTMYQKLMDM